MQDTNLSRQLNKEEELRQQEYLKKAAALTAEMSREKGSPLTCHVTTFGCQMNARDSEKLEGILLQAGYKAAPEEEADFVIFNTCTVRENADQRLFGRLGRLSHIKKSRRSMKVALCGCMMQEESNVTKIRKSFPFVDLIFGTHNLYRFPEYLYQLLLEDRKIVEIWNSTERIIEQLPVSRKFSYKSGVNIMFGCNNFCTYCIVPYVRGRERSRDPEDILRECEQLAQDGVVEIMLLGQNVNSYGRDLDTSCTFPELLEKIAHIPGLKRIRFMTPHPKDLSDELIRVIKENPNIARHVHLPLQSGNNEILRKMNRHYTREQYLELAGKIRREIPDVALTTDIIVGFPGETLEQALETADIVEKVGFDNAYTFIYSRRVGTPAAAMEDPVSEEEKKQGFDRVLKTVQESARLRAEKLQGRIMEGLAEEVNAQDPSFITCRLSNNMLVHIPGTPDMIGHFYPILLRECRGFYYFGEIAKQN